MNIIKAIFSGGCTQITAAGALWQWDQGQILQIVGLDLPDVYQVEFSNQPVRGTAAPMIGGVDGVEIPDVYLTTGKPVYAFVVLHAGEDDRETEYKITIPVNARPQPTNEQPTPEQQGVIDQLIAALNAGVEKAEDAADEAEGAADDAAAQAGLAAAAKVGAEAAQAAAELAQANAESFAAAASGAEAAAETAQGKAEDAQDAAEAAQAAAESAKAGALAAKAAAETAQGKAEDAQEAAEQAAQDAHVEYEQLAGQVTAQGQTIAQHGQAIAQNTADIADLDTELTRQKSAFDDLTALVDRKAGMLVDTASGAIASFVPDSTIDNLLGVTVDIEPVQDLHGQDSPYPAGGGKNKFDGSTVTTTNTSNWGIIWDSASNTLTIAHKNSYTTGTPSCTVDLPDGTYVISGTFGKTLDFSKDGSWVKSLSNGSTFTIESGHSYRITFQNTEATTLTYENVMIESGSTPSAYAPYENLCPISGWDSVEVDVTGLNLVRFPFASGDVTIRGVSFTQYNGSVHINGTPTAGVSYNFVTQLKLFAGKEYTISFGGAFPSTGWWIQVYSPSSGTLYARCYSAPVTFTVNTDDIVAVYINTANLIVGTAVDFSISPQLELSTTASEYKPFAGNRYTIQLGQTVYGGTLSIAEDGSVNALVDRVSVDMGTLNWFAGYNGYVVSPPLTPSPATNTVPANILCDVYKTMSYSGGTDKSICRVAGTNYVRVRDSAYSTAAAFKTAMNGHRLVYELASPITIQLDPVTISTIADQTNNVWSDAGDARVEFAADLKHYIDSKIAAAVAALS